MAAIEFAFSEGVWHKLVKKELDELESEGTFTSHELTESALFELQILPYEDAIMVLKNMYNKPIEKDMSEWITKECEEMWQKYATVKEVAFYKKAKLDFMTKLAAKCSEKRDKSRGAACKGKSTLHDIALAADILRARRDVASKANTKAAGGAASQAKTNAAGGASSKAKTQKAAGGASSKAKTKAAGGAASQAKPQPSGGAGSKGPEGFHYVRTPDGQTKKVFEPTTEENPIVIDD
jgi:hypothetical protein